MAVQGMAPIFVEESRMGKRMARVVASKHSDNVVVSGPYGTKTLWKGNPVEIGLAVLAVLFDQHTGTMPKDCELAKKIKEEGGHVAGESAA